MTKKPIAIEQQGDVSLNLSEYLPFYVIAIANRWTATSSRTYLRRFGIGIVEWRAIASLGALGVASSLDVVNLVGTDPASVSKAVNNLEARGLVVPVKGKFAGRTKPYELTQRGRGLFREMRQLALRRQDVLTDLLTSDERSQLIGLLKKLHAQLPKLQDLGVEHELGSDEEIGGAAAGRPSAGRRDAGV